MSSIRLKKPSRSPRATLAPLTYKCRPLIGWQLQIQASDWSAPLTRSPLAKNPFAASACLNTLISPAQPNTPWDIFFSLKYIFSIFVHLVFRLEVLQDPGVVLRLLEVGEGDAGDQVDLLSQRLALVVVLEVLGVEFIILGVGGDRVVVVGAVQVVAAVGVPGVALEQLLAWEYISCLNLQQIILKSYQFPTW